MLRLSLFAIFAAVVLAGCNRPAPVTPPNNQGKDQQAKVETDKNGEERKDLAKVGGETKKDSGKVDFSLASVDLIKEYQADEKAAEAKYKDKLVEVTGKVDNAVFKHTFNYETVLDKEGKHATLISAKAGPSQFYAISRLTKDQKVKVVGRVGDFYKPYIIYLNDCVVTPLEDSKLLVINAGDLAKELDADRKKTTTKYSGKAMVVTGKMLSQGNEPPDFVILEGTPKTNIKISSAAGIVDDLKNAKVGEMIEVRAYYSGGNLLSDGILLTKKP